VHELGFEALIGQRLIGYFLIGAGQLIDRRVTLNL
jgi:hypothetical protein